MVMWGVGEDDTKGKHGLHTTKTKVNIQATRKKLVTSWWLNQPI